MTTKKRQVSGSASKGQSVQAYLAELQHPCTAGVEELREAILAIDPRIGEAIKWNAPSFYLADHFATFRLNPVPIFQLVMHAGAKPQKPPTQFHLTDPQGLAKWAAPDRCVISFASVEDAREKRTAVVEMVTEWIAQL